MPSGPMDEIAALRDAKPRNEVWFNLQDSVLELALRHVIGERGDYRAIRNPGDLAYRVTDIVPPAASPADVLLARTTALSSQIALGALVNGVASALVSTSMPEELGSTLDALQRGVSAVPASVLVEARSVRHLTGRQHQVLGCLAGGLTRDRSIAARIVTSAATVKRDLHQLGEAFSVHDRHELATKARELGYSGVLSPVLLDLATASV
jgi:DNA-binding NarL/FixJ family response regulator